MMASCVACVRRVRAGDCGRTDDATEDFSSDFFGEWTSMPSEASTALGRSPDLTLERVRGPALAYIGALLF